MRWLDRRADRTFAVLLLIPAGLVVGLVVLPPILAVFGMSLLRIELAKDDMWRFVALNNFTVRLPLDSEVLGAVGRTVAFGFMTTMIAVPLALVAALILKRGFRAAPIFAACLLLPWAVAPVVTGIFWRFIFTSQFGLANGFMSAFGLAPQNWLEDTGSALAIAITASAWRSIPLLAILLLAALKTIPDDLYRAARMDGASSWHAFRWLTLPAIRPTLLVVGILQIIIGVQTFDVLFTLTGGGPGRQTYVLSFAIVENAFSGLSFGYASALTVVLFGLIAMLSVLLVLPRLRRRQARTEEAPIAPLRLGRPEWARTMSPELRKVDVAGLSKEFGSARVRTIRSLLGRVGFGAIAGALLLFLAGPIIWIAIASFQTEGALTSVPLALEPRLNLDGYLRLLGDSRWLASLAVSLQVSVFTAAAAITLGALVAYPLARIELAGKSILTAILVFTQMIPAIVMAIPVLLMFQAVHLKDTVAALVIVNTAFWTPLVAWLLRGAFERVPRALEAAARMDGCSRLGTLFRVTIPAAGPGIAAVAILVVVGTWNEFLFAMILGDRDAVTLTRWIGFVESYTTVGVTKQPPYHLLAAAGVMTVLPCLALVTVFQKRLLSGITGGLPKG